VGTCVCVCVCVHMIMILNNCVCAQVWGTPYEVGYAQGTIQKDEIIAFVTQTWDYLSTSLVNAFPFDMLSPEMKALIVEKGLDRALDWTREMTAPFTPQVCVCVGVCMCVCLFVCVFMVACGFD
jgi:hypothetical protein